MRYVWIEAAGKMAVTLALDRPARENTLQASGEKLSGGRCAPGAMQRKGIAWRRVLWQRRIPGDDLRSPDQIKPRGRQRRHVQRLADMAGGIGPIRMLVEEGAARRKI
jgi:hypothetical protein